MSYKADYKVFPADPNTIIKIEGGPKVSIISNVLSVIAGFCFFASFFAIFSVFSEGNYVFLLYLIVGLLIIYVVRKIDESYRDDYNADYKRKKVQVDADILTEQLLELLEQSAKIKSDVFPSLEKLIKERLHAAQRDFKEHAYYPFWTRIEEVSVIFNRFIQASNQLSQNRNRYMTALEGRKHSFPSHFPVQIKQLAIPEFIEDYSRLIEMAHKDFRFANIWSHFKTHNILIAGFQSLENAISIMQTAVVNAIQQLDEQIEESFSNVHDLQKAQLTISDETRSELRKLSSQADDFLRSVKKGRSS